MTRARATGATPAMTQLRRAGVDFVARAYDHDPAAGSFGLEAATALGVEPARVFKTLVVAWPGGLGVTCLPVDRRLDLKAAAAGFGVKKVEMADPDVAQRSSGYVVGGISPFGQRTPLPTLLDASADGFDTILVSGGRRGLDLEVAPSAILEVLHARTAPLAR